MEKYITIGTVINTQGVKGDIRIYPETFNVKRFDLLKEVYLENPKDKSIKKWEIEKVWYHKAFVILKLTGIDDMTQAERLKNFSLLIPESDKLPLEKNEYYISDIYDMEVYDESNNKIGTIADVLYTGGNDIYVIKNNDSGELLLPAIGDCIKNVDVTNKKMIVHILEGLEWINRGGM